MDPLSLFLFVLFLVLLAFFAGTEIPLMSISQHKIDASIKKNKVWARSLKKIKEKNESLLIVNLIWTTFVTIAISSIGTLVSLEISKEFWISWSTWAWIAVLVVSWIVLFIWEIIPKILGVRYSEQVAFLVAPIYRMLMIIFFPITIITWWFIRILNFITGSKWDLHSKKMSSEEFEAFIDMSHEKWAVEADEHKKIKWVLDLSETLAESVMTPRVQLDAVSIDITVDELCEFLLIHSHSRIPIYKDTIDQIDYFITFKQAFKLKEAWRWHKRLSEIHLDPIIKVPLTQPIDKIFKTLQKSRKHLALVLDEYGWVEWIITIEDIIEEVFGDIKDETDREWIYINILKEWKIITWWTALIEDILDELKIKEITEIGLSEDFIWENISYIISSKLERFPEKWEKLRLSWKKIYLSVDVKQVNNWKMDQIIIEKFEKQPK